LLEAFLCGSDQRRGVARARRAREQLPRERLDRPSDAREPAIQAASTPTRPEFKIRSPRV
jgi:hypothetical protein